MSSNNIGHSYQDEFSLQRKYSTHFWSLSREDMKRLLYSKGDLMNYIEGSHLPMHPQHTHFKRAVKILTDYVIPSSMEEFLEIYNLMEMECFCEHLFLAIRLNIVEPNLWQNSMLGLWMWEHSPEICSDCGLNRGYWCSPCKSISLIIIANTNNC